MAAGYICPVCDYPKLSEPPRSEFGGGSFEICPSCGYQFGVNDDDEGISYETWRRRWEAAGMPWRSTALKPPAIWKPVAKHVAPGGAALRRPDDPASPATQTEPPAAPARTQAATPSAAPAHQPPATDKKAGPSKPSKSVRPAAAKNSKTEKPAAKSAGTKPAAQKPAAKKAAAKKPAAKKSGRR